jgi:CheY-like chemotaxis protein
MAKRVLIADDEPNIVTSLEFLMEQAGYEIRVATNGQGGAGPRCVVPSGSPAARYHVPGEKRL